MRLLVLIFAVAVNACATQKLKDCSDQDQAVVLQILMTAIDLKLEPLNGIKKLTDKYGQKMISKAVFEKELNQSYQSIQKMVQQCLVAI